MKKRILFSIILIFVLVNCGHNPIMTSPSTPNITNTLTPTSIRNISKTATPTESKITSITKKPTDDIISTSTRTLTPSSIQNIIILISTTNGVYFIKPPSSPVLISSDIMPWNVLLTDDGTKAIYLLSEPLDPGYINKIGSVAISTDIYHDILTPQQINVFAKDAFIDGYKLLPNTSKMLFTTKNISARDTGWIWNDDLYILDFDTRTNKRLFNAEEGGIATPSPNGMMMAITKSGSISLATSKGEIIYSNLLSFNNWGWGVHHPEIIWSDDSLHLGTIIPSYEGMATIWSIDVSNGTAKIIGTINGFEEEGSYGIASTLDHIVFTEKGRDSSDEKIYLASIDQFGQMSIELMAAGNVKFISFSPDGQHFAYYSGSTYADVYVSSLDGNTEIFQNVTPFNSIPCVHPLIQWINNYQFAYVSNHSIWIGDIEGTTIQITDVFTGGLCNYDVKEVLQ